MKYIKSRLALFLTLVLIFMLSACNQEESVLTSESIYYSEHAALEKIVEDDESLQSFDLNYNEEDAMDYILGKTVEEIFPIKVGQRMKLVDKNLDIVIEGDTAYGTLTKSFDGVLFILASDDSLKVWQDSLDLDVYEKLFSTTITRNLIFVKLDNSNNPLNNWKISQVSLPVGGTISDNISIENMKVFLPDGKVLEIDSPLEYYLSRGPSFSRLVPSLSQFKSVQVEVNIKSAYEEKDFVTLTYGALKDRKNIRAKRRFRFVEGSETFDGTFFYRTFKGEWIVNQFKGFKHAVINAFPWGVLKDSEAPVESNSWGIPYIVK